jgi:hypothetical protein
MTIFLARMEVKHRGRSGVSFYFFPYCSRGLLGSSFKTNICAEREESKLERDKEDHSKAQPDLWS